MERRTILYIMQVKFGGGVRQGRGREPGKWMAVSFSADSLASLRPVANQLLISAWAC